MAGNSAMIAGNSAEELIHRDVDRYGRPTGDQTSAREPADRPYGAAADPMAIHIRDADGRMYSERDYNTGSAQRPPHVSISDYLLLYHVL